MRKYKALWHNIWDFVVLAFKISQQITMKRAMEKKLYFFILHTKHMLPPHLIEYLALHFNLITYCMYTFIASAY